MAIAPLGILAILSLACGGDDDENDSAVSPTSAQTAASAAEVIPDLAPLGFRLPSQQPPGFAETATSAVRLFENPGGKVKSLRFEIGIDPTTEAAANRFSAFSAALKNPPPGLFGPDAKQTTGTPAFTADQSVSYKTNRPDPNGTLAFTDLHRFGRTVVILYTIGPDTPETAALRKTLGEQMSARAPR